MAILKGLREPSIARGSERHRVLRLAEGRLQRHLPGLQVLYQVEGGSITLPRADVLDLHILDRVNKLCD